MNSSLNADISIKIKEIINPNGLAVIYASKLKLSAINTMNAIPANAATDLSLRNPASIILIAKATIYNAYAIIPNL